MIVISGYVTYIDWAEWIDVEIDETKIHGFQLDYRGGGEWFVIVHPKEGKPYQVKKGTGRRSIAHLLSNPQAKILRITNEHNSKDFVAELMRVMPEVKTTRNNKE